MSNLTFLIESSFLLESERIVLILPHAAQLKYFCRSSIQLHSLKDILLRIEKRGKSPTGFEPMTSWLPGVRSTACLNNNRVMSTSWSNEAPPACRWKHWSWM